MKRIEHSHKCKFSNKRPCGTQKSHKSSFLVISQSERISFFSNRILLLFVKVTGLYLKVVPLVESVYFLLYTYIAF